MTVTGYTGNNLGKNRQYRRMIQYAYYSTGNTGSTGNPNVNTTDKKKMKQKKPFFYKINREKVFAKSQKNA